MNVSQACQSAHHKPVNFLNAQLACLAACLYRIVIVHLTLFVQQVFVACKVFSNTNSLSAVGTAAAQRARGAASSSLQPINTARAAAKQSSPAAAPTAEDLAVRQAALASLHKGQESSSTTLASPRQPQATPILRLRPTVQQVLLSCFVLHL